MWDNEILNSDRSSKDEQISRYNFLNPNKLIWWAI
jgi:hypothetical protein